MPQSEYVWFEWCTHEGVWGHVRLPAANCLDLVAGLWSFGEYTYCSLAVTDLPTVYYMTWFKTEV